MNLFTNSSDQRERVPATVREHRSGWRPCRPVTPRHPHRPDRAIALAVLVLVLAGCGETGQPLSANPRPLADARQEPRSAKPFDGDPLSESPRTSDPPAERIGIDLVDGPELAEFLRKSRGRVVLVDFWATWCGTCMEQFPHMVELHDRLSPRGLTVVSVSLDEPEDRATVLDFLRSKNATLTNYLGRHGGSDKSMEEFDIQGGLPHYKLYDRRGKLLQTFGSGPDGLDSQQIDATVERLLGS